MWGGSTHNLKRISSWSEAHKYYEETKPVRSTRWQPWERPLLRSSQHHYRVARQDGPNGPTYDVYLYRKKMARFLAPHDGVEVKHYAYDNRSMSRQFLYGPCGFSGYAPAKGKVVHVPCNKYDHKDWTAPNGVEVPEGFFCTLVFKDGLLDLDKSAHRPCFTKCSNETDSQARKDFLRRHETLLDLMVLRLPEFHANAEVSYDRGCAFGGMECSFDLQFMKHMRDMTQAEFNELNKFAQELYNTSLSKRAKKEGKLPQWGSRSETGEPLMPAAFRKSLSAALIRACHLDTQNGRKDLGQFPEALPKNYVAA